MIMKKPIFNSTIIILFSCILLACGSGSTAGSSPVTSDINITESNLTVTLDLNKPKVEINIISHAWYSKESPNEYETGESFTIKATLNKPTSTDVENKIKLVTSNTGLIYESDECTINNDGYCNINVTIAESANLGESSLAIQSNTNLVGTTKLEFKVVAGNIIFFTAKDVRQGNFASAAQVGESAGDITNKWCNDYAKNTESLPELHDRYRNRFYKGMILGNPATITGNVYYRTDAKTKIAVATNDYLADDLENSIKYTGLAGTHPATVWTGWGDKNCKNWTYKGSQSGNGGGTGQLETDTKNKQWFMNKMHACSQEIGIYCVSQPNVQAN